jgi:hypothetical protein
VPEAREPIEVAVLGSTGEADVFLPPHCRTEGAPVSRKNSQVYPSRETSNILALAPAKTCTAGLPIEKRGTSAYVSAWPLGAPGATFSRIDQPGTNCSFRSRGRTEWKSQLLIV